MRYTVTVVTKIWNTVHCCRPKSPQCFRGWFCLHFQVKWGMERTVWWGQELILALSNGLIRITTTTYLCSGSRHHISFWAGPEVYESSSSKSAVQ